MAMGRQGAGYASAPSAMRPIAQHQHASSRAVAQLATEGRLPRADISRRLATSLFTALAAWFSIRRGTSGLGAGLRAAVALA